MTIKPMPLDGPDEWLACGERCAAVLRRQIRETLEYGGTFGGGAPPAVRVAGSGDAGAECYECETVIDNQGVPNR